MNDIIGIAVVMVAIACMWIAQRKSTPKAERRLYSLLGSAASIMIAVEAARRSEPGVLFLFATAAAFSLIATVMDYLKPTKPDA